MIGNRPDIRPDSEDWRQLLRRGILFAGIAALLCSCAATQPLPCRFADDYRLQVVYLSPNVAISKRLNVFTNDTQAFFTLGRVHWIEPVRAMDTGDRFEEWVQGTIKRVGRTDDGQWLVAESDDYDWAQHRPLFYVTAIELSSGRIQSAADRVALLQALGNAGAVSNAPLEPVEYFFERELFSRLVEKRKQAGPGPSTKE